MQDFISIFMLLLVIGVGIRVIRKTTRKKRTPPARNVNVELAAEIRPFTQSSPSIATRAPDTNLGMRHGPETATADQKIIQGKCWVIDGDTIVIDRLHIRLSGIDAPELDHPWGKNAKFALVALCKGQTIKAIMDGNVSHDRAVAQCFLPDGRDLSAEMVKAGFALDWPKYSGGRYRALEAADARKRFWRAHLRQQGKMTSPN